MIIMSLLSTYWKKQQHMLVMHIGSLTKRKDYSFKILFQWVCPSLCCLFHCVVDYTFLNFSYNFFKPFLKVWKWRVDNVKKNQKIPTNKWRKSQAEWGIEIREENERGQDIRLEHVMNNCEVQAGTKVEVSRKHQLHMKNVLQLGIS